MVSAWIGLVTGGETWIAPFSRWASGGIVDAIVRRLVSGLQRPWTVAVSPFGARVQLHINGVGLDRAGIWGRGLGTGR